MQIKTRERHTNVHELQVVETPIVLNAVSHCEGKKVERDGSINPGIHWADQFPSETRADHWLCSMEAPTKILEHFDAFWIAQVLGSPLESVASPSQQESRDWYFMNNQEAQVIKGYRQPTIGIAIHQHEPWDSPDSPMTSHVLCIFAQSCLDRKRLLLGNGAIRGDGGCETVSLRQGCPSWPNPFPPW